MRITNRMMTDTAIKVINNNLTQLARYQQQLATGERISRPSDDPIATARLLTAKSELKSQEQFHQNMRDAVGWLDATDGALELAGEVLQQVRELAINGSTGTLPPQSMVALSDEANQLIEELVGIGNTNYAGRYIFAGSKTTQPPFTTIKSGANDTITEIECTVGTAGTIGENLLAETYTLPFEVETGVVMDLASGRLTFHTDAAGNPELNSVFGLMTELRDGLAVGDQNGVNNLIGRIDKAIDNLLSERAITGAKSKRVVSLQERSATYELDLKSLIGRLGYVEYEEATINFKTQEAVYHAALATSAKVIQPTLMDFLR